MTRPSRGAGSSLSATQTPSAFSLQSTSNNTLHGSREAHDLGRIFAAYRGYRPVEKSSVNNNAEPDYPRLS